MGWVLIRSELWQRHLLPPQGNAGQGHPFHVLTDHSQSRHRANSLALKVLTPLT